MKRKSLIFTLLLAMGLFGLLMGCGNKQTNDALSDPSNAPTKTDNAVKQQKTYKFGFANLTEEIPFAVDVRKGIEKVAKENGIELVIADNRLDGATALANAENFITQKVDFVIEFQTDAKFGEVIMGKFNDNKIPVIAIDIPMPGAVFMGANNHQAGFLAGEAMGKKVKESWNGQLDKVIMLELPQSGDVPKQRMQGQLDGLKSILPDFKDKNVIHIDSKGTPEVAKQQVQDTLTTLPDAKHIAVLSINDDTALGALAAFEITNRKDQVIIVGQGADKRGREEMRKENSPFLGSTGYFPEKYGEYILPAALQILKSGKKPENILVDHVFISKDNVDQYYQD